MTDKLTVQLATLREIRKNYQDPIDQHETKKNELQNQIWRDETAVELFKRLIHVDNLSNTKVFELSGTIETLVNDLPKLKNDLEILNRKSFSQEKSMIREIDAMIKIIQADHDEDIDV